MKKTRVNPFDSKSENRYKAFAQMRAEASVHETQAGQRFMIGQRPLPTRSRALNRSLGVLGIQARPPKRIR